MVKYKKWLHRIKKPSFLGEEKEVFSPSNSSHVNSGIEEIASCCSTTSHVTAMGEDSAGMHEDVGKVLRYLKTGDWSEINATLKGVIDFSHENKGLLIQEGGMQVMLRILEEKRPCQVFVLEALISLFGSGLYWRGAFDAGNGPHLLVKMLKQGDLAGLRVVPHLLDTREGMVAFHAAGGIEALTGALVLDGEVTRTESAKGLSQMARMSHSYQDEIVTSGALTSLTKLCTSKKASGVACMILMADLTANSNLAWSEVARSQSWDPIMSMLSSRSPEMREAVARILFNVSESWECQRFIPWKKAVKRLLACLDSGQTEAELWMLRSLSNFWTPAFYTDPTGVALGWYYPGPGKVNHDPSIMGKILARGTPACRREALRWLTTATAENDAYMKRSSTTVAMVKSLVESLHREDLEFRCQTARLLSTMMCSKNIRRQVVSSGGVPPLVQLLKSGGQGREAAVDALVQLSEEKSVAGVVISQGATDALAVFLSKAPSSRQLPIMETLSNLARSSNFHFTSRALLQTLIELLRVRSGEVVFGAAKCLASILNKRRHLHQDALNGRLLFRLENMLMESWPQKRAAVTLLAQVSYTNTCKATFRPMDSVLRMLPYESLEGKNCIAGIMGDLVTNQARAQLVLNFQTHRYLLKLLDSASHGPAVRALTSIAVHSSSLRGLLASDSNLRKIIPKLAGLDLRNIADAARYIGVIVRENVAHQNRVAQCGGIPPLVQQLSWPHSRCKAMSALALAALVEKNASTQQAVVREGAIPHLVLQLDDEDDECRQEAAHALANLTFRNPQNQFLLAKLKPGKPLLKLLEGKSSTATKCHAGRVFSNLVESTQQEVVALRKLCIRPLVAMLSSEMRECQENAAKYLANLAICGVEEWMIFKAGGIPPLVNLARFRQPNAQKHAVRALANLSCQADHVPDIVSEGGIPILVNLLSSIGNSTEQAVGALANIACNAQSSRAIIEAGGIRPLLDLLSRGGDACQIESIRMINNMATYSPAGKKALIDSGALNDLAVLLKEGSKAGVKKKLIRALISLMSDNEEAQLSLMNEGMVESVVAALKQAGIGDPQVEMEARRALLTLCCGVDGEGAAKGALQAGRVRCVVSVLDIAPSPVKEGRKIEEKEAEALIHNPRHLCCPISLELMEDPVMAVDGYTYERSAITKWFRTNKCTSPMTNQALASSHICPNRLVASMIQEFRKEQENLNANEQ
ncbi:hypothetical protein BSKO_04654 [Bryopsis sp. KO-2023]|nr:hypothetical protein BSKO_04654 [Bryopsis sp. KO-2023]